MLSKVYYSKNSFDKIVNLLPTNLKGKTGIKVHFGERNNVTFLVPKHAQKVYDKLISMGGDISLVECNVLYRGSRTHEKDHVETAKTHGFDFAPIDICDGEHGEKYWEIEINQKHCKTIKVGKSLKKYDNLITLSHFKGHPASGFGGALKNLGMGLGSRAGKMQMHATFALKINKKVCIGCGICVEKCDANAIKIIRGRAEINFDKCLHCAGCIANCPRGAVEMPWGGSSSAELQERVVEYCYGLVKSINCPFYINVLEKITSKCDCFGEAMKPIVPDLGFLASADPVALDQASYDFVKQALGKDIFGELHALDCTRQLEYAQELGLGKREYELVELGN